MSKPLCPRCLENMSSAESGLEGVWSCIYCEGTWVTPEEVDRLVSASRPNAPGRCWRSAPGIAADRNQYRCPSCASRTLEPFASGASKAHCCTQCRSLYFAKDELPGLAPLLLAGDGRAAAAGGAIAGEFLGEIASTLIASLLTGGLS